MSEKVFAKISKIRSDYCSAGDVVFRCAIQHLIDVGAKHFSEEVVKDTLEEIDKEHSVAKSEGKHLIMSADFEKAIVNCAAELANIDSGILLAYIQRNIWYDVGLFDPSYNRLKEIAKALLLPLEHCHEYGAIIEMLRDYGINDDELMSVFGFSENDIYGKEDENDFED
jgi:hypothetical protein